MVTRVDAKIRLRMRGFTFVGLLFLVALMGISATVVGEVWHAVSQREKEKQLLFVGNEFRQAIERYYRNSPGNRKEFPRKLEDLLLDPRYPSVQRYLRKIYMDPMTGTAEWGVVSIPGKGIMGVHSLSENQPIKVANFRGKNVGFEGKAKYSDWMFVATDESSTAIHRDDKGAQGRGALIKPSPPTSRPPTSSP